LNAQYKANESTDGKSDSSAVLIAYTSLAKHKPGIVEDFESLSIKLMKMHDNRTLHTLAAVLIDSFGDIRNQTDTITADRIENEDNRELYNHHKRTYYNNSDSDLIGDIIGRIEHKAIFPTLKGNLDNHKRIIQYKADSHLSELTSLVKDLWSNNYDVLDVRQDIVEDMFSTQYIDTFRQLVSEFGNGLLLRPHLEHAAHNVTRKRKLEFEYSIPYSAKRLGLDFNMAQPNKYCMIIKDINRENTRVSEVTGEGFRDHVYDRIKSINGQEYGSLEEFRGILLAALGSGKPTSLVVIRG